MGDSPGPLFLRSQKKTNKHSRCVRDSLVPAFLSSFNDFMQINIESEFRLFAIQIHFTAILKLLLYLKMCSSLNNSFLKVFIGIPAVAVLLLATARLTQKSFTCARPSLLNCKWSKWMSRGVREVETKSVALGSYGEHISELNEWKSYVVNPDSKIFWFIGLEKYYELIKSR